MSLSSLKIQGFKPAAKQYKKYDADGLFILVMPHGAKLWRLRYKFEGRERLMSLGSFPETPIGLAREKRDKVLALIAAGKDPIAERQETAEAQSHTFQVVAEEWLRKIKPEVEPATFKRRQDRFTKWVFPRLGSRPVGNLTPVDVLKVLRVIEGRGLTETAHRTKAEISRVFCYAVATGRQATDVTASLKGALIAHKAKHHPAITSPFELGGLLRAIDGYQGHPIIEIGLKLTPHVFLRPQELRAGAWSEIDFERKEWRIPAERMKMAHEHVVPLSRQALALLTELKEYTGGMNLMFPTTADPKRPMSNNTINACLRRLGYDTKTQQCAHGFRSTASTLLSELGFPDDIIELQLAHTVGGVKGVYKMAVKLEARRQMMQAWSDYLDKLRDPQSNVTPMRLAS